MQQHSLLLERFKGAWAGNPAYIVGGGPSLKGFDWRLLAGRLTIGINRAFEQFDPTIIFSMDNRFLLWVEKGDFGVEVRDRFQTYDRGYKIWLDCAGKQLYPEDILPISAYQAGPWSDSLEAGLAPANNSGYGALNLAALLQASPIYLLGFDMGSGAPDGRQEWWHDGYKVRQRQTVYDRFLRDFRIASQHVKAEVKVVGASRLDCWPKISHEDFAHLLQRAMPVVVSHFTFGTPYEQEVERLRESARLWGLTLDLVGVPSQGSWVANTQLKPRVLLAALDRWPDRELFYLDADATIERYPTELTKPLDADIAVHFRNGKELLSGSIRLANTERSRALLRAWIQRNEEKPRAFDQRNLQEILEEGSWKVEQLPADHCAIFDGMPEAGETPAVLHWQASRKFKRKIS